MMNKIFGGMLVIGLIAGMLSGKGGELADAMIGGMGDAVILCLELCGAYMFWMGIMEVARDMGLIEALAKYAQPVLGKLFPNAKQAVAPITLNLTANFFGMGSAATPFGLEAMEQMQRINPDKTTASNDMCMFLSLNSSALELLPTGVIALRSASASADPYCIVLPTFLASIAAFAAAIGVCKLLEKRKPRTERGV